MAQINNTNLKKELINAAKINISTDRVPSQTSDIITPVVETNPNLLMRPNIVKRGTQSTTGQINIYTTPTDRDFYLTNYCLSMVKDATCDIGTSNISLGITLAETGETQNFSIPTIALTAERVQISQDFVYPIKIKRNTTLTVSGTFAAGVLNRSATIVGWVDDTSNA